MQVPEEQVHSVQAAILNGDRRHVPGLVRIAFGLYNTHEEIDACIAALQCIACGKYGGKYYQDVASGQFYPEGWQMDYAAYMNGKIPC